MKKWSGALFLLAVAVWLFGGSGVRSLLRMAESAREGVRERETVSALWEGDPEGTAPEDKKETKDVDVAGQQGLPAAGQTADEAAVWDSAAAAVDACAYSWLETQEERQLYREILGSLANRESETLLSTLNQELLEPVFRCVLADHPEIFYVDGYTSTSYKLGDELKKITFAGDYTMSEEEIAWRSERMEETLAQWLMKLPDADDYERAKYLYEYLISHTEYEMGCEDSQNISSVLLNGRSVCQGYAKTFQLLCQRAQIPALLVTGTINGQGHAWDLIRVDAEWYYVDPTWGDASYRQVETEYPQSAYPSVNYDYFCVTTEQLSRTHTVAEGQWLPLCTAVDAQYYRREGLYLEQADPEQIAAIFDRASQRQEEVVTFQCADESVYREVYRLLIEEQKVFDYLPSADGRVAYADSPDTGTFSFWIS